MAAAAMTAIVPSSAQNIKDILSGMTLREKIAQIIIVSVDSGDREKQNDAAYRLASQGLGGVIVMDDKLTSNLELINRLQAQARIPLLVSIDGEWGASMRYYEYEAYPRAMQLGALNSPKLVYEVGAAIGKELREINVFANYAPVADINNNPANPVINTRSFGQDREKVAEFASAYMQGMRDNGVFGSAKHFPGHGDTDVDSHKGLPVLTFDRNRLDSLELYPFRRMIEDGVEMVMIGHLSVPALDPSGTPASISKPIITGLLRNEMGFKGIIITDALQMKGLTSDYDDASVEAYKAGADILLMPLDAEATIDKMEAAFKKGELNEKELDWKVLKVLDMKRRAGMLDESFKKIVDTSTVMALTRRPETNALIQEISDKSMTVVTGGRNLPLKALSAKNSSVAYVAYNAKSDDSAVLEGELKNFVNFDTFFLNPEEGDEGIARMEKRLKGYKTVIIGFHCGVPVPHTGGPHKFAKIDSSAFAKIASWSRKHKIHGLYFGNPYDLNRLPAYKKFNTFTIAYADTKYNNRAAARALFTDKAEGSLPVDAGGLRHGYSSTLEIKEMDAALHPSADISPMCSTFTRNQVRTRRQMENHDNLDIATYVASAFPGFVNHGGTLYSNRSGSFTNGLPTLDVVQLYAMGMKVGWSYVSGMTIKDVENIYVLRGNEAALYQAYGGVVILELKSAKSLK